MMKRDERGRPYFDLEDGKRSYVSPVAFGEAPPEDTTGIYRHGPKWDQTDGTFKTPLDWGNILNTVVGAGLTMGIGSAAMGGGAGINAASQLGSQALAGSGAGMGTAATAAIPAAAGAVTKAGTGMATKTGWLGKAAKGAKGLDYTSLILGGLSMLGGDDSGQERKSFEGTGADPTKNLSEMLEAIKRLGKGVQERGPVKLRSSYVPPPPVAVNIPGIPFQIGGGLGRDPALDNPDLLEGSGRGTGMEFDPFQVGEGSRTAKRRLG